MVLQLQLTLSTIPAFHNPAVRELFEGFHASLSVPFFRVTLGADVAGRTQHGDGSCRYLFVWPCVRGKLSSFQLT